MKKILAAFIVFVGLGFANAQQVVTKKPSTESKKVVKKHQNKKKTAPISTTKSLKLKKDGTVDRRYKENKHLKKDGTADKRYKVNKK